MQSIEQQYLAKKRQMIVGDDDFHEVRTFTAPQTTRDEETIKMGKENKRTYGRPVSSKVYSSKVYSVSD